jgi:hypothetical protein
MRWGQAVLVVLCSLVLAGAAAAAWQPGIYKGTLRNPGYGTRGQTPAKLFVTRTQVRLLSAQLSFRCPGVKNRVPLKVGPLKPAKMRVRPGTGGALFAVNQKVGSVRITVAGGITPGKPLQAVLDASRDTPNGICEDSALLTAKPR